MVRFDEYPAKPDCFQCFTNDSKNIFYGPAVKVSTDNKTYQLGFVVHAWDSIIAVAVVSHNDNITNLSDGIRNAIIKAKNVCFSVEGLPRLLETGNAIDGLDIVYFKFSINQWRHVVPKLGKKTTKFNFCDVKPEKLAVSKVQRLLNE